MSCRPWFAAILVAVSGLACAQEPQADAPAPAVAAPDVVFVPPRDPPLPLLWQASDADNTVYLLGSFHLLKPDDYPLSSDVNDAFADAEAVVFEMPPEEKIGRAHTSELQSLMRISYAVFCLKKKKHK